MLDVCSSIRSISLSDAHVRFDVHTHNYLIPHFSHMSITCLHENNERAPSLVCCRGSFSIVLSTLSRARYMSFAISGVFRHFTLSFLSFHLLRKTLMAAFLAYQVAGSTIIELIRVRRNLWQRCRQWCSKQHQQPQLAAYRTARRDWNWRWSTARPNAIEWDIAVAILHHYRLNYNSLGADGSKFILKCRR